MRRILFLVALLGAISFTAGCDDKKTTSSGGSVGPVDPMKVKTDTPPTK